MFMLAMLFFTGGMQMQIVAQGWLVYHISGSGLALGIVTSMWSVSAIVFSPIGGVVADRMERRRLLILTWGAAAAIFAVLTILIMADLIQVWHLALGAFLHGALFSFNIPARFAFLAQLVGNSHLMSATALISVIFNFTGAISPLIGGGLIDLLGPSAAYLIVALLYLLTAGVTILLPPSETRNTASRPGVLPELIAGIRYILKDFSLRWLWVLGLVTVVLGQPYFILLPGFAAATLGLPAFGLGLLFSTVAVGALVGNLMVASLQGTTRLWQCMLLLGAASGVSLMWLALTQSLYPALAALFILGVSGLPFFTLNQTEVQLRTAPEMRGRVLSLFTLTWAAMPLGAIPVSSAADKVGFSIPILFCGGAILAIMVVAAWLCRSMLGLTPQHRKPSNLSAGA